MIMDGEPYAKKRKIAKDLDPSTVTSRISSAKDLKFALQPDRNDSRTAVQLLKEFLQSINADEKDRSKKLSILKSYWQTQSPGKSGHTISLHDLFNIWASSIDSQSESLLSALPSVLALLLKTVSSELDFRDLGLQLCKDLLQKDQLRLLDRGLTANRTKEHLISPCLRLLTEVVSFDGGASAALVYGRKEVAFKRLDQFLGQKRIEEGAEHRSKKPSLRRIAQRYVIANLKFQTSSEKTELLTQGGFMRPFLYGIKGDSSDIVIDILDVIEQSVIKDATLLRHTKHKFLTYSVLSSISTLYAFDDSSSPEVTAKVRERGHQLLLLICTSQEEGILRRQTGWYPHGNTPESKTVDILHTGFIDLDLDSMHMNQRSMGLPQIKNSQLSGFIHQLRPENSVQAELMIETFRAAPELVADYFSKKTAFPSDPKETSQWLGFSALVFSTIQLPLPEHLGWGGSLPLKPPPTAIVIENILPRPLDRQTSTRCLNLNQEIVTLFAVRTLTAAFRKLGKVLDVYKQAPEAGSLVWQQAASKVIAALEQRCPLVKDIISLYYRTSKSDKSVNEAVVELLALYFKYLPELAMAERFDVSIALVDVLQQLESNQNAAGHEASLSRLTYLLDIAQASQDTRWWNKPESLTYSPFISLLRVACESTNDELSANRMLAILTEISIENGILVSGRSLEALLTTLQGLAPENQSPVYQALDMCVNRVVRRPAQYLDILEKTPSSAEEPKPVSLLVVVLAEQCQFIATTVGQKTLLEWLRQLFQNLEVVGEDRDLLQGLKDNIMGSESIPKDTKRPDWSSKLARKIFESPGQTWTDLDQDPSVEGIGPMYKTTNKDAISVESDDFDVSLRNAFPQVAGVEDELASPTSSLHRWEKQDVEDVITSGTLASMIRCFRSTDIEIRLQTYLALQRFMHKFRGTMNSGSEVASGWQTVYILLGSLLETIKPYLTPNLVSDPENQEKRIPAVLPVLAEEILQVLVQPLHPVYPKANLFLLRSPVWQASALPSYFISVLLLEQPAIDTSEGYYGEATFLLRMLNSSLKTAEDLNMYRQAKVFERVLSWSVSPGVPRKTKMGILELIYRAAKVDGNMTMATRAGILSWLEIMAGSVRLPDIEQEKPISSGHGRDGTAEHEAKIARALKAMILSRSSSEAFAKWSGLRGEHGAKLA